MKKKEKLKKQEISNNGITLITLVVIIVALLILVGISRIILTRGNAKLGVTVTGENKIYSKNGTAVIPVGFHIVNGLDDVSQGLVIADDTGNEFVWIPVSSEIEYVRDKTYEDIRVSESAIDDTDYLPTGVIVPEGKTEGEVEKEMVVQSGGFYIGRYETGKEMTDTLVCKKGANVWIESTQEDCKEKSKSFINNEYVKSGLITGIQWDVTMAFVNGKLDGEGNPYDVTKKSKTRHPESVTTAGQNEADRVCNIYDLEGNYYEYVAEKNTYRNDYPYVSRGAHFSNLFVMASSFRDFVSDSGGCWTTFRLVLYV